MANARGDNLFFCIGCQKSGTTILARVLDQHPDIACLWEAYFFNPKHDVSVFNPNSDAYSKHGFDKDKVIRWHNDLILNNVFSFYSRLNHKFTGRFRFAIPPYKKAISEAFDDFATRCNAKIVGDKWPWYVDFIDQMLSMFPDAKYIYTVRDPRGIWNSAQRFKGRERGDEILNEMLTKEKKIVKYLGNPNFLTVRYEDIILKPSETAKNLYEFLGFDFKEQYLKYDKASDPYPDRWNWVPEANNQLDPKMTSKWKELMSKEQIDRVNSMSNWFIAKYDYER
jgi:hypothetical protein